MRGGSRTEKSGDPAAAPLGQKKGFVRLRLRCSKLLSHSLFKVTRLLSNHHHRAYRQQLRLTSLSIASLRLFSESHSFLAAFVACRGSKVIAPLGRAAWIAPSRAYNYNYPKERPLTKPLGQPTSRYDRERHSQHTARLGSLSAAAQQGERRLSQSTRCQTHSTPIP